jgi:hypothetical protein
VRLAHRGETAVYPCRISGELDVSSTCPSGQTRSAPQDYVRAINQYHRRFQRSRVSHVQLPTSYGEPPGVTFSNPSGYPSLSRGAFSRSFLLPAQKKVFARVYPMWVMVQNTSNPLRHYRGG